MLWIIEVNQHKKKPSITLGSFFLVTPHPLPAFLL